MEKVRLAPPVEHTHLRPWDDVEWETLEQILGQLHSIAVASGSDLLHRLHAHLVRVPLFPFGRGLVLKVEHNYARVPDNMWYEDDTIRRTFPGAPLPMFGPSEDGLDGVFGAELTPTGHWRWSVIQAFAEKKPTERLLVASPVLFRPFYGLGILAHEGAHFEDNVNVDKRDREKYALDAQIFVLEWALKIFPAKFAPLIERAKLTAMRERAVLQFRQ